MFYSVPRIDGRAGSVDDGVGGGGHTDADGGDHHWCGYGGTGRHCHRLCARRAYRLSTTVSIFYVIQSRQCKYCLSLVSL